MSRTLQIKIEKTKDLISQRRSHVFQWQIYSKQFSYISYRQRHVSMGNEYKHVDLLCLLSVLYYLFFLLKMYKLLPACVLIWSASSTFHLKPLIYLIRAGGIVEGRGKEEGFTGYMEIWSLLSSWVPLYLSVSPKK